MAKRASLQQVTTPDAATLRRVAAEAERSEPPAVVRTPRKAVLINIKVAEETAIAGAVGEPIRLTDHAAVWIGETVLPPDAFKVGSAIGISMKATTRTTRQALKSVRSNTSTTSLSRTIEPSNA
jgi:hypothetical protein